MLHLNSQEVSPPSTTTPAADAAAQSDPKNKEKEKRQASAGLVGCLTAAVSAMVLGPVTGVISSKVQARYSGMNPRIVASKLSHMAAVSLTGALPPACVREHPDERLRLAVLGTTAVFGGMLFITSAAAQDPFVREPLFLSGIQRTAGALTLTLQYFLLKKHPKNLRLERLSVAALHFGLGAVLLPAGLLINHVQEKRLASAPSPDDSHANGASAQMSESKLPKLGQDLAWAGGAQCAAGLGLLIHGLTTKKPAKARISTQVSGVYFGLSLSGYF